MKTEMIHNASTTFAKDALAMCVVHHQEKIKFIGNLVERVQRCHIAVHAENTVGNDHRPSIAIILVLKNNSA